MYNIENCKNCITCGNCQQNTNADIPTLFCMHCQPSDAPCILVCSNNAFEVLGGAITINNKKCTGCKDCVDVCPINIIKI